MAGIGKDGIFKERISPFLRKKMEIVYNQYGEHSGEYLALYRQYVKTEIEDKKEQENNSRHWEADMSIVDNGNVIDHGLERLYNQCLVIEPTMICAAHCRYCLRGNYKIFTLTDEQILEIAQYCGRNVENPVSEILISGGDPLIVPRKLDYLLKNIVKYAPNVKRARIGTRLPQQDPERVDNNVFEVLRKYKDEIRIEIATQTNHAVEFFPETVAVFNKFKEMGFAIYSQNVLLKGVNDDLQALVDLYRKMREVGIEAHYLFHSVPMRGMHHMRTSVQKGIDLARNLTNSGLVSGRAKPMFALMTDIGKITMYDGVIIDRDHDNRILIQSSYRIGDRLAWNPDWKIPETAYVDENGFLRVWYLDGE